MYFYSLKLILILRYFISFAYKGTHYHGWQEQPKAVSVQQVLTEAMCMVLKENISLVAAGRTDAGVHAKQMYAHFDSVQTLDTEKLTVKLNSFLPFDIAIYRIFKTSETAHARFDATARTYTYHITQQKNPFLKDTHWYFNQVLDVETMNQACEILKEYTNFQCFSKVHTDVKTFNCSIRQAYWEQHDKQLVFTITADRFLRNMVRAIVGTLINVGLHKQSLADFRTIIESRNRSNAGFSVPAQGLFLVEISYPYI